MRSLTNSMIVSLRRRPLLAMVAYGTLVAIGLTRGEFRGKVLGDEPHDFADGGAGGDHRRAHHLLHSAGAPAPATCR